ncbi:hypothetical protein GCM10007108_13240 [Thermogymnomonas acidicola]|uniref:Transposase n=1 Tax=Thermogymnomonas acidicola TaxID=399579 RepID=A0AA37BRY8_9ARCH|nr:hypothetical protein [Thermogymnomonas acidicola]GGM76533.1 hypothetical protein GCM10007108_13240 [Thermogymnomonas acidicola]
MESNGGKRKHPDRTPDTFITFLARLRAVYDVPYRPFESFARIFAKATGTATVSCTSIFRRIRKIVLELPIPVEGPWTVQ